MLMTTRRPWRLSLATTGVLLGLTFLACQGELETNFGPPGGLDGKPLPQAEPTEASTVTHPKRDASTMKPCKFTPPKGATDAASEASPEGATPEEGGAEETGPAETGTTPETGGGTSEGGAPEEGGATTGGGHCSVSWSEKIYPNMTATGTWACANSSCHGPGSGTSPTLSGGETSFYEALAGFQVPVSATMNLPVLAPCETDPAKSAFVCITSSPSCADEMPPAGNSAGAQALTASDITLIKTWIACGAIDN
jgi:hypothetical protein